MQRVVFDEQKCKGCELCVHVCPEQIIFMGKHRNSMGYNPATVTEQQKCISCALCARICPDAVISVYRPDKTAKEGA